MNKLYSYVMTSFHITNMRTTHNSTHLTTRPRQQTSRDCHSVQRRLPSGISRMSVAQSVKDRGTSHRHSSASHQVQQRICCSTCFSVWWHQCFSLKLIGVTIDQHLTFDNHVTIIVQSCNYNMRGLRHIRQLINHDKVNTLSWSIVGCRLD